MSNLRIDNSPVYSAVCRVSGTVGHERYENRHAALCGEPVVLMLWAPRYIATTSAKLHLFAETAGEYTVLPMQWCGIEGGEDRFSVTLDSRQMKPGLCFFAFSLETLGGEVFSYRIGGNRMKLSSVKASDTDGFQLLFYQNEYPSPKWLDGGIIYQIFVDRFYRGNETEIPDGMEFVSDWSSTDIEYPQYPGAPMKNNRVYGGNLDGIRRKLGYLASLGVSLLYLTPIFRSPSNHKYDTGDYMTVDPLFGSEADLKRLIEEAGELGIRVMLDGVFNHTGADSLYFNRYGRYPTVGAYQSKESPYYDWYSFKEYPDRYVCWWDIEILPRINPDLPSCRNYFVGDGGVVSHYASLGIGGFRLDVADELSDDFIRAIKARLSEADPSTVLYGEVWEDASSKIAYGVRKRYYHGGELDGVMNYPLRVGMIEYLRTGATARLREYFEEIQPNAPKRVADLQMNLVGTHDTVRILTALAGEDASGKKNSELKDLRLSDEAYRKGRDMLIAAYAAISMLPGVPMIYYGDEIGMQGYSDPFNRLPMAWDKADETLLRQYRRIGRIRRRERLLEGGDFELLLLNENALITLRHSEKEAILTVLNRSNTPLEIKLFDKFKVLFGGRKKDGHFLCVPRMSTAILKLDAMPRSLIIETDA